MAQNQEYEEFRVNSLPTSGLVAGNNYLLNLGAGKFRRFVVSDSLELVGEAGAEFIEKDTVAELRAISAREIWAIQNGYYKGVKLNGYYKEGDTPAPIEYYLSDTTDEDDGGSVFEVGGIKFEHSFVGQVDVRYFGVLGDGSTDNTPMYVNLTRNTPSGSSIIFEPKKTYIGSLEVPLGKSYNILGNGAKVKNAVNNAPIIRMQGIIDKDFSELTSPCGYGDVLFKIPEEDAQTLSSGDILVLSDGKVRLSDSLPEINNEVFKVKHVDGEDVYIEGIVRSYQNVSPMKVWKVNPIKDIIIKDLSVECDDLNSGFPIQVLAAENVDVSNIETYKTYLMAISVRYSFNVNYLNLRFYDGVNKTVGGAAYGATLNTVKEFTMNSIRGVRMRHTIDLQSCYTGSIRTCRFEESFLDEIQLAHNTYGGNITVEDVDQEGGIGVISWADLGDTPANLKRYIIRDVTIKNIRHTVTRASYDSNSDKRLRTVFLGGSLGNVIIDGVRYSFLGDTTGLTFGSEHRVIRVYGIPSELFNLSNVQANIIGHFISFGGDVATLANLPTQGLFVGYNLVCDECSVFAFLGGVSNITIDGLYYKGESGTIFQLTQLGGQTHTKNLAVKNISVKDAVTMYQKSALYSSSLLNGGIDGRFEDSESYNSSANGFLLTDSMISGKKEVVLNNTSSDTSYVLNAAFLPQPTFKNQTITINVTGGGSSSFSFSPSTNNIVFENGVSTSRMEKLKSYTFISINNSGVLQWKLYADSSIKNVGAFYNPSSPSLAGILYPQAIKPSMSGNQVFYAFNSGSIETSFAITKYPSENYLSVLTFNPNTTVNSVLKLVDQDKVATTSSRGVVNQATAVPDGSSIDTLLAALRTAGILAT